MNDTEHAQWAAEFMAFGSDEPVYPGEADSSYGPLTDN